MSSNSEHDNSDGFPGLRDYLNSILTEPGRDYKNKLEKLGLRVRWHLNRLENYLKARDAEIQRMKELLGEKSDCPWIPVVDQLPPLGESLLVWDADHYTFDRVCFNPNALEIQNPEGLLLYLEKLHITHWQRVYRPAGILENQLEKLKLAKD